MTINEFFKLTLSKTYNNDKTDADLAKLAGCSREHINKLRNGKFPFTKVKLETLLRLFPELHLVLGGVDFRGDVHNDGNIGPNSGTQSVMIMTGGGPDISAELRRAILSCKSLCPNCALTVLSLMEQLAEKKSKGPKP